MDISTYPRGVEIFTRIIEAGKETSDEPNFAYPVGHVPRSTLLEVAAEEVDRVAHDSSLSFEERRELIALIIYLVYRRGYGTGQMHFEKYRDRFAGGKPPKRRKK